MWGRLKVYDRQNRLVCDLTKMGLISISHTYKYTTDFRKILIQSNQLKNRTNYKTIIKERLIDSKWVGLSELIIGEKYVTYNLKNHSGNIVMSKCYNRITKKTAITNYLSQHVSITTNGEDKKIVLKNLNINKLIKNGK